MICNNQSHGKHKGEALRVGIDNEKALLWLDSSIYHVSMKNINNDWDNEHPSRLYFGYPYNHRRLSKQLIPVRHKALRTKKLSKNLSCFDGR